MKKYSWNFDEDAEMWGNDTHDTIEECIEDAQDELTLDHTILTQNVFIGENMPFLPYVDAERLLDNLQEDASEFAGEVGGDWNAYDYKKRDEIDELSAKLSEVVVEWMKKYGYYPEFYQVSDIKEYVINVKDDSIN